MGIKVGEEDPRIKAACQELRPKDEGGYKKLFDNWIEDFHYKFLECESLKSSKI